MLLDLNKLRGQREHFERTFPPSAFDPPDSDYRVAAPVELVFDVTRLGDDAHGVAGRMRTRLAVECSRCLEPFRSEEHTSELQSRLHLVCRLLLEKKKQNK